MCLSLSLSRVCVCVCVNGDPFKKISSLVRLARAERDGETSGTIATANRAFRAQRDTCTRARARLMVPDAFIMLPRGPRHAY